MTKVLKENQLDCGDAVCCCWFFLFQFFLIMLSNDFGYKKKGSMIMGGKGERFTKASEYVCST
jgi:hypothetical protein